MEIRYVRISSETFFSHVDLWHSLHAGTLGEDFHESVVLSDIDLFVRYLQCVEEVFCTDTIGTIRLSINFYHMRRKHPYCTKNLFSVQSGDVRDL